MQILHVFFKLPRSHKISISTVLVIMIALVAMPSEDVNESSSSPATLQAGKRYPLELDIAAQLPSEKQTQSEAIPSEPKWHEVKVKSGDTLARIFKRLGFSAQETYRVTQSKQAEKALVNLMPGDTLNYQKNKEGKLQSLTYALSPTQTLKLDAQSNGSFDAVIDTAQMDVRTEQAQGIIKNNFWRAADKAGLSDAQIMNLAGIFGWDIDFAMEIRRGDVFNVVFEEHYVNGEFVGHGDIIAAEFVNQGEIFQAIRHSDGNYYTPEGRSMRKSFLRAPVNFRYVSSNFTKARFHPVQKRWKAHRGTDYVAAVGTPIMAAGDGKVVRAGYDKYNGHHVFIKHGEKYTTKYLHFKKRAVKKGQWVKQGQTIGYLGSTGMVTGAHLHYEFLVDGVHRNPRTVTLPKARPIKASEKSEFMQLAKVRLAQLNGSKRALLASNELPKSTRTAFERSVAE